MLDDIDLSGIGVSLRGLRADLAERLARENQLAWRIATVAADRVPVDREVLDESGRDALDRRPLLVEDGLGAGECDARRREDDFGGGDDDGLSLDSDSDDDDDTVYPGAEETCNDRDDDCDGVIDDGQEWEGLPTGAVLGNFFRTVISIPFAVALNLAIGRMLHLAGVPAAEAAAQFRLLMEEDAGNIDDALMWYRRACSVSPGSSSQAAIAAAARRDSLTYDYLEDGAHFPNER